MQSINTVASLKNPQSQVAWGGLWSGKPQIWVMSKSSFVPKLERALHQFNFSFSF